MRCGGSATAPGLQFGRFDLVRFEVAVEVLEELTELEAGIVRFVAPGMRGPVPARVLVLH